MLLWDNVEVKELSDEELKQVIEQVLDKLGLSVQRYVCPDYSDIRLTNKPQDRR
jgi:hypothetical protein